MSDERDNKPSMSGIERDLGCDGNRVISRGLSTKERPWTKDGNLGHDVLAGEVEDEDGALLNKEDLAVAIDRCREISARIAKELGFTEPDATVIEQRIWLHDDAGNAVGSGRVDRALIKGKSALLLDWKLGRKAVTVAPQNPQAIGYCVLLAEEFGIDEAHIAIVQPWVKKGPIGHVERETLALWRETIIEAWARTQNEDAPRTPGNWCDYCPARGICPEARAEFSQLATPTRYDLLDSAGKLQLWDVVQHVEKTVKEIKEQFRADLERDPLAIPGLKMKPGAETITVPIAALRTLIAPEYINALTEDPSVTLTAVASVLTGGRAKTKALSQDGKKKKAELREAWMPHLKITEKAGSIERVSV